VKITIESRAGAASFESAAGEQILFAGLQAGLALPYDCATGTCGMCKARLVSGSIAAIWPQAPAFAKLQRERGDLLMCQSTAETDCVLKVPAIVSLSARPVPKLTGGYIAKQVLLTQDVMQLDVHVPDAMTFEAGQFAVLTHTDTTGGRAYSMVNHTHGALTLEFVVKKKQGGALTAWLFAADRTKERLGVFAPLGRATFNPIQDGDLVCIAGGSGIAGILSIMAHAIECGHFKRHTGRVFFGVRSLADGFYLDRFSHYVTQANGALEVVLALSDEAAVSPIHPQFTNLKIATGLVHDVADRMLDPVCSFITPFVAGPPLMVDGAIRTLIAHGVPSTQIRYDKFG
jgi:toluene monooxygenase electron transfer component